MRAVRPPEPGAEAAFFDLDKTVIAKASIAAFSPSFYRQGLISRRSLLKAAWSHLVYVRLGASAKRLARIRRSVLAVTAGWEQAVVRQVVAEALSAVIDPITYAEAVELIGEHRRAGRRVYLVSAAPFEIVEPLARHLGVHEAIASEARIDEAGRYTGQLERYAFGPAKAVLMRQIAERDGLDLDRSWAYTDSVTDLPMLEAVGHPVAVNPDRPLRRIARVRGWDVQRFERLLVLDATAEVPVEDPAEARRRLVTWGWAVPLGLVTVATGSATAVLWWRRSAQR